MTSWEAQTTRMCCLSILEVEGQIKVLVPSRAVRESLSGPLPKLVVISGSLGCCLTLSSCSC